jgi:hypothetical protein
MVEFAGDQYILGLKGGSLAARLTVLRGFAPSREIQPGPVSREGAIGAKFR